jgi:hypothetical protein
MAGFFIPAEAFPPLPPPNICAMLANGCGAVLTERRYPSPILWYFNHLVRTLTILFSI